MDIPTLQIPAFSYAEGMFERPTPKPEKPQPESSPNPIERLAASIDVRAEQVRRERVDVQEGRTGSVSAWLGLMGMALETRSFLEAKGADVNSLIEDSISDLFNSPQSAGEIGVAAALKLGRLLAEHDNSRQQDAIRIKDKLIREIAKVYAAAEENKTLHMTSSHLDAILDDRMERSAANSKIDGSAQDLNKRYVDIEAHERSETHDNVRDFISSLFSSR